MEKPIPGDYDLNAHSNWWKTVNGVDVENLSIEELIDMLNHNISFREFTLLMFLIKEQYRSGVPPKELTDKLDFLHYGTLPFKSSGYPELEIKRAPISVNKLSDFLDDERRTLSGFVNKGLTDATDNYGNPNKSYFLWYLSMLVRAEMFEGNKNANYNDLLKGKILYKPLASWNPDTIKIDNRTLYEIMYLEPVSPSFSGGITFQYNYKHKKDYYFRCKNGRPYKLTRLNITVNEFNENMDFNAGLDINRKKITWNFGIQNLNPGYDRVVYSKLSGLQAKAYQNYEFKSKTKTYFIPDNDVGRLWSKSKADILTEGLALTMNQELQHIDVLKNTSTINYLSKQADLKYFGDVQDVPIMNLNDIDITGYKIKSKPIHFINWLKSNNPLGGGK